MSTYWDSCALVLACSADGVLRTRLQAERGITRTHTLAETFSGLTSGNLSVRVNADKAAAMVDSLAQDLDFVDLSASKVLSALKQARKRGVRGGRVHDFLHAVAAEKARASILLTSDKNDFRGLADTVSVEILS